MLSKLLLWSSIAFLGACVASDEADTEVAAKSGPIVCFAYPCCGDGVCDEPAETCMLCPQDCGCDPNEICLASEADPASSTAEADPGAVCVADTAIDR
jgi:hypothetical protein